MLVRALVTVVALSVPVDAQAAGYVVQRGDTLSGIAERAQVPVEALARANGIQNPNLVRAGQVLFIPSSNGVSGSLSAASSGSTPVPWTPRSVTISSVAAATTTPGASSGSYIVQSGDTLYGLALRYHTSVDALRQANPSLGRYLLVGQRLTLCTACASVVGTSAVSGTGSSYPPPQPQMSSTGQQAPAVSPPAYSGTSSPGTSTVGQAAGDTSSQARALITAYAQQYGLDSSLPLAIGAQESGFQQTAVSGAGAIGVMQVLPNTAQQISALLGRPVNLYSLDDNIHAGVFWLAHLVAQYRGNEQLAAAAYYQGSTSLASHGLYQDTVRYVSNAMRLKSRYGG